MINPAGLAIVAKHINAAGLQEVERNEGDKHAAYRDIAGVVTIGYGHTGPDVHMGLVWTEAQCIAALRADLAKFEAVVFALTHDVPTTDNQFSAMVSLTYNIGPQAFRSSTVLGAHRQKHYDMASAGFLFWDKAHINGRLMVVPGLLRRRQEERALYLAPDVVVPVGALAGAVSAPGATPPPALAPPAAPVPAKPV